MRHAFCMRKGQGENPARNMLHFTAAARRGVTRFQAVVNHVRALRWREVWNRGPKWMRRSVLIVLGVLFAVPVVTNVVLWLRIVPWLLNADSAAIHYSSAWSPWPTRIRLHGLLITGRDPNVEFAIGIDEAWLTLDLWSAVSARTIKITRVRGSGTSVRVLQRLDPLTLSEKKLRALPDIPGFPKPPVTEAYVRGPRATREHYDQISVDVSDIDAGAKELWIDEARYRGRMHVVGAFLLRPGLELHIGPGAAVTLESGTLEIAGRPALTGVTGRAACRTPYFNPVEPEGLAILAFFSGSLVVHGALPSLEFANYFLDPPGTEVHGGVGRLDLELAFVRGVIQEGSVDLSSRGVRVASALAHVEGSLLLKGDVAASKLASLNLKASELSLGRDAGSARLSGGNLSVDIDTLESVNLAKPPLRSRYRATLTPLSGDVAAVQAYIPEDAPIVLDRGHLTMSAEGSGGAGRPGLKAQLELQSDVEAHAGDRRFAGKLRAHGELRKSGQELAFDGTNIHVADLMVIQGKDVTYGWWTHAEVSAGAYTEGKSPRLGLDLTGGLRDIEPLFVAFGKDVGIPGWVQDLLPLPNTTWHGHLATSAGGIALENFRATSGAVEVRVKLAKPKEDAASGAVKIAAGPLSFGVAFQAGETHTKLLATDHWFEQQQ